MGRAKQVEGEKDRRAKSHWPLPTWWLKLHVDVIGCIVGAIVRELMTEERGVSPCMHSTVVGRGGVESSRTHRQVDPQRGVPKLLHSI